MQKQRLFISFYLVDFLFPTLLGLLRDGVRRMSRPNNTEDYDIVLGVLQNKQKSLLVLRCKVMFCFFPCLYCQAMHRLAGQVDAYFTYN